MMFIFYSFLFLATRPTIVTLRSTTALIATTAVFTTADIPLPKRMEDIVS